MTLTETVTKKIIAKLIKGQDYRIEIVALINSAFLQYVIEFFKKIIEAKLGSQDITVDWYKREFLRPDLPSNEIAINAGLNRKTITNMYNTARREIVLEASESHYDELYQAIKDLAESESEIDIILTLKFNNVSVDLNINESLIVINTLAVKRAELRGGSWSTAGKRVEKPLMITLCKLFAVPDECYKTKIAGIEVPKDADFEREVDFYLCDPTKNQEYKCEVKLMGKGNPESADAVIARDSRIFIADKLSDLSKKQLNSLGIEWTELRSENGFLRFGLALSNIGVPYRDFNGDIDSRLESILAEVFNE